VAIIYTVGYAPIYLVVLAVCMYLNGFSGRFVARLGLGGGGGGFVEGYWLDGDGDWVDVETVTVW
jgi:hypothetical protein